MRFDNRLGLKHADTQPFFLGRAERPEQRIFDELFGHPATVVTYRQSYPLIVPGCFHCDPAIRAHRIARVEKKICTHASQLLAICQYPWDLIEFGHQLRVERAVQVRERLSYDVIEIQFRWLEAQLMTQRVHAVDKIVDPAGRTADSAECILPERGIVEVPRQILQHEAKGRSCIL